MSYKRHRFPRSFRLIEDMLLKRGIVVSYEMIGRWSLKFGLAFARSLRRKPARRGDVWSLDEVWTVINGNPHWLWRAVDQDGYVLDDILQTRRNPKAARRLLTRLPCRQGVRPMLLVTNKLRSYGTARRELRSSVNHVSHKGMNNRAENSHLALRQRERGMRKFRSPSGCQRFVSVFSAVSSFHPLPMTTRSPGTSIVSGPLPSGTASPGWMP